jgi:diacylglycerol kinase (ATP)
MQTAPLQNIAIVCNALAGAGKAVPLAQKIADGLTQKNIAHTFFNNNWPGDFNNFTSIFIVGGDGTLNYFVNHYPGIKIPLVIFNGGTGNDFHWLLYGNKTFDEQLQTALTQNARPIDLGKCNERYFINGVGIGFEGAVAKALLGKRKLAGKASFMITILKNILTYRSKNYFIKCDEKELAGKRFVVDISNGRRAGGGFHIAPEARADDGLFDIVIADVLSPLQRLRYLPAIEKGRHLNLFFIHHFRTKKIIVESNEIMQYHLDGEYFESSKLNIEIFPSLLNFIF